MQSHDSEFSPTDADISITDISESLKLKNKQEHQKMSRKENIFGILLLLLLYMSLGLFSGYFSGALPILASAKGATYAQLGTLAWIQLPFSFKFLIAPFVDAFYIKKLGKRKTYVVLVMLLMGVITILFSFKIQEYFDKLDIFSLFLVPFILCYLLIHLDVATDAWSLTLVDREYYGYGRTMKLVG